ncbi:MAG: aminoacyl-tRNA hydrolase [Candidatus Latescibacteria bacterium]|nr:aminoacyl-tRNA hydrolase [Candidatus Latescibacterota bacterium]
MRRIPLREIEIRTSRSSGPGGQNVNKLETRVEALWNVNESAAITDAERARVKAALRARITAAGLLRVTSQRHRTQAMNRESAIARLESLVAEALKPRKRRRPTTPTPASEEARLSEKKRRSRLKRGRAAPPLDPPGGN